MDNITHSLAGLLLAGAATEWRTRRAEGRGADVQGFARVAALTGVIGANLPDADVLWGAVLQGAGVYDDLLSLLHHRGYTHTLLAAMLFIPALWATAMWWRGRQQRDTLTSRTARREDSRALLGLSIIATLSHVTLDFTNDYGVHPFSPFVNAWAYGDSVFIIEPWLWVVAIVMLRRLPAGRWSRAMLWVVLVLGLSLSWLVPQVSMPAALAVTAGAVVSLVLSRRVAVSRAPLVGIAAWLVVTAAFASGTYAVRASVRAQVRGEFAASARAGEAAANPRLVDVMTSPSAANPICARVITVETTRDDYRLTTAWGSALPSLVSAAQCSAAVHTDTTRGALTLPMVRAARSSTPALQWQWTWRAPRAELAQLSRENCRVATWLRFVRAPFWVRTGGDSLQVGDLRYDRERVSVAAFTFASRPATCPRAVPPWTRPRQGVLSVDGAD